jgi:phage I-like protein
VANFGFWIDLSSIQLSEDNTSSIQAMPLGDYQHPVHGKISFTPERVQRFADNVNNGVRGQALDIDYDHKEFSGIAAGWVQAAEASDQGLKLSVQWTPKAAEHIKAGEYRYFSPEFSDSWTHPKSGQKFDDVLFGGALTNRPFLKDIAPVNMSEVILAEGDREKKDGGGMNEETRKQMAALLGLPDDATEEQILGAMQANKAAEDQRKADEAAKNGTQDANKGGTGTGGGPASGGTGTQQVAASEGIPTHLTKLAETNPELAAYLAEQQRTIQNLATANRLSEADATVRRFNDMARERGFALPPAATDQLKTLLSDPSVSPNVVKSLSSVFETIAKTGLIQLGEQGGSQAHNEDLNDDVKKFNDEVERVQREKKLSWIDAVDEVSVTQPQLYEGYRTHSYAFREN